MKIVPWRDSQDLSYVTSIIDSFDFDATLKAQLLANLRRELRELGGNRTVLVARSAGQWVGTLQVLWREADQDPTLANGADTAHLHGLWVAVPHQRRGHARGLISHAEAMVAAAGFTTLTLGVDGDNPGARRLYESMRYAEFRREPGRTPDAPLILMRKPLPLTKP